MKLTIYIIVFIFMFLETTIASHFPYYALTLSFLGYMAYNKNIYSVFYAIPIAFFVGVSSEKLYQIFIFYILYVIILNEIYKNIMYDKINIFLITIIETLIYIIFLYLIKKIEIDIKILLKEGIFILMYNYVFYYFNKAKLKKSSTYLD